ncbi:ribonuclease E/G [Fretibacter rubidus]|uniref:Rne/Rng family ribonuclease n=1 Tax=Fretibacter rubidus TaxID=570162 RepID=UPI00352A4637
MSKKMLIDASHPEETRVVIVNGTRVEELDFESRNKRQLRGNVYLARVTRVEPSLQAAFVEYGGNRHGFLAFSEIHPDYYQIPYEDRMALIEAEEADNAEADEEDEAKEKAVSAKTKTKSDDDDIDDDDIDLDALEAAEDDEDDAEDDVDPNEDLEEDATDEDDAEVASEQVKTAQVRRKRIQRRRYKIQEVIKRGQILLIQAVKEERGNKGAAMTTYLSLAGRYCVLMPNTPRGGGISRKIANSSDRKHLKAIVNDLNVPPGIGVIVRTAGSKKTKADIKRDYDYLTRLWETIRETTLKSTAPALIHEEGNLVKRAIRDMYNGEIDEILVQGDDAYRNAKDFIKMLMPSHAKNVKHYKDSVPLYLRYEVEKQIENSLQSVVQLKSGGYLVIHPTEALVSVDVNSGRSTKERNVERTALKTNLEAAEEVARQMRLRDLAGLIVIDFIDMDENRNNRAVEKKMKTALSEDRARVQYSRISQFGLMEISRQRRRRSLLEGSTASCEHCDGVGRKRTIESSALAAIRAVEEIGARGQAKRIKLKVSPDVALYVFNEKRDLLTKVDEEFNLFTELSGDENLIRPSFAIEIVEKTSGSDDPLEAIERENKKLNHEIRNKKPTGHKQTSNQDDDQNDENDGDKPAKADTDNRSDNTSDESRGKRRRRGRRGGRNKRREDTDTSESTGEDNAAETKGEKTESRDADSKPKRSRGRRRKAQDKDENTPEGADAKAGDNTSDKPKGRRRAAPKRNSQAEQASWPSVEPTMDAKTETTEKSVAKVPSRKGVRAAPGRKPMADAANEAAAETKPQRTRKAPTKKAPTKKAPAETATAKKAATKPAAKKAPSRKAPAKAANADKAPVKKAPAKKAAPKKAATKTVASKKAPAKTTAAKKASTKKAPAKKAAVKKAPAKKAAATKEAPTKKAPAKKSPVKETTAAKPASKPAPIKAQTPTSTTPPSPSDGKKKAPARRAAPSKPGSDDDDKGGKKKGGWLSRILK